MDEEQQSTDDEYFVPESHNDVPEEITFPFKARILGDPYVMVKPDPAQIFQIVNECQKPGGIQDQVKIQKRLWSDYVRAEEPGVEKPPLFQLQGDEERNLYFGWFIQFSTEHFLGGALT